VSVPVTGEVLLASDQPTVSDSTELPGHSFAILRHVNPPSTADPAVDG
jgi:maltooligosyltrehalose trehalohydrolase